MTRVVVTGASGLLGSRLVAALVARGADVVALSRVERSVAGSTTVRWDPESSAIPEAVLDGASTIVNLAGEPIGEGRWTAARRRRILESRTTTTRRCVDALGGSGPGTLVNASAVGYYGGTEEPVDESSPAGDDFLAGVCARWEGEAVRGEDRARVVRLRTGIVLARDGGVLPRLLRVARLGAAGPLGSGRQWTSWIHVEDAVAALLACVDDERLEGPVNAVAPHAVRQRELARALARLVHRPSVLPAPAAVLRLVLGQMADLVLIGQSVEPAALGAVGFEWRFPTLDDALLDLVGGPSARSAH